MNKRKKTVIALILAASIAVCAFLAGTAFADTLRRGSTGQLVRELQTRLKRWGYYTGAVDGVFGAGTEKAVRLFQKKNGLTVDGIVGAKTAAALGMNIGRARREAPAQARRAAASVSLRGSCTAKPAANPIRARWRSRRSC